MMKKRLVQSLGLSAVITLASLQPVLAAPQSIPSDAQSEENARAVLLQEDPLALTPAAEPRATWCLRICVGQYRTATTYSTGSSCTVALSNLTTLLRSLAVVTCKFLASTCDLQVVQTVPCLEISPGVYRIDGYAWHGCKESTC